MVDWLRQTIERQDVDYDQLKREAAAILLLGSVAYRVNPETGEHEPRYRPKVHLSVRSLTPLTMALHLKNGVGKLFTAGETEYTQTRRGKCQYTEWIVNTQAPKETSSCSPIGSVSFLWCPLSKGLL